MVVLVILVVHERRFLLEAFDVAVADRRHHVIQEPLGHVLDFRICVRNADMSGFLRSQVLKVIISLLEQKPPVFGILQGDFGPVVAGALLE